VRAGAVAAVMATSGSVEVAAWVVVLTYPLTLVVVGAVATRSAVRLTHVPGSLGQLWRNTAQTMTASAGVGALITGFPVLLSATSRDEPARVLGALTLAVMLTRAPLLVPLTGMQSFLVSAFTPRDVPPWRLLGRLLAAAAAVAAVLSVVAWLVGDQVLTAIFGEEFSAGPGILALLVASSGCLAAMALAAPALIARGALAGNALAWVVASLVAAGVLVATPWGLGWRAGTSLVVGPSVGLVIQLLALRRSTRS
jgi:O-antigen/teichoic acid export membrane protein